MATLDDKAVVRRFIDEVFVAGSTTAVDELTAPDAVFHTYPFGVDPRAGMRAAIERVSAGHLFRIRDGQVREHWHQFDQMGMMRQLGLGPGA